MRVTDEDIRFHLTKMGWFVDDTQIEIADRIGGMPIIVTALDAGCLAYFERGKIFISKALAAYATLPQRRLAILHELAHSHINPKSKSLHDLEYACDKWALKEMMMSGEYNKWELLDAIYLFGDVVDEQKSRTHPSSRDRNLRLLKVLKEYGL